MKERIFIKSHLQFKQTLKKDMIFRRAWHYQDESVLDRKVLEVQTNGFWVQDPSSSEPLWVDFLISQDWVFQDGKVYMIFNHEIDKKRKEKELNKSDFERYKDRWSKYVSDLLSEDESLKIKEFKILGVYEILT